MLAPEGIDLLENKEAFSLTHQPRAQLLHLAFLDVIGITQLLLEEGLQFLHL